jgi:O-antigen/teichoic acid export membrane protein
MWRACTRRAVGSPTRVLAARNLARSGIGFGATTVWLAALGLISTPLLIDRLGASAYGVFALITILTAYLSNLELGFGHATIRFLAQARAADDRLGEARVLGVSASVFIVAAVIAAGAVLVLAGEIVEHFVNAPAPVQAQALEAIRISAAIVAGALIGSFASSALQALGALGRVVAVRAVFGTLASASAIAVVLLGGDVVDVIKAQVVVNVLLVATLVVNLWSVARSPLVPRWHRPTLVRMGRYGALVLLAALAYQAGLQGPPTILAGLGTTADVAAYAVPALVFGQVVSLAGSASIGFLPYASAAALDAGTERLAAVFASNLRLIALVLGPLVVFLAVFAPELISAWISPEFAVDAAPAMRWLAAAGLFVALSTAAADVARGHGRAGWLLAYTGTTAILGGGGALALAGREGAAGAAASLCIALAVTTVPFTALVARRLLAVSGRQLLAALAGPGALLGAFVLGLAAIGAVLSGIAGAVIAGALLTPLYVVIAYRYVVLESERAALPRPRLRR